MEDALSNFLDHILKLSNECHRRSDVSDIQLITDIHNRLQYSVGALKEIKEAMEKDNFCCNIELTDLNNLIDSFVMLEIEWKDKKLSSENKIQRDPFLYLKSRTVKNGETKRGRPKYEIDFEIVRELAAMGFYVTKIAAILGVHRATLYRHLRQNNIVLDRYNELSENEIDEMVNDIKKDHPFSGERMLTGFLQARGVRVTRSKLRDSIHRVDPINTALRWVRKNPRYVYSVPGPSSLWHNDGLHKLIHWRIVIHACIDGFSRVITSLVCADNNRADTALKAFLSGVREWGLPSRVRGDHGTENNDTEKFMEEKRGEGRYIRGPSVHNQRIERLHYDTTHTVLAYFINLFKFMEEKEMLVRCDESDIFCLHFVYLPRIQKSLDEFRKAWLTHPMSSEKNMTPEQLWTLGMIDCNNEQQRAVRDYLSNEHATLFGVEGDINAYNNNEDQDSDRVVLKRVDIGENQDEILSTLRSKYDPLEDDGNHGISLFMKVKNDVIRYLS